MRSLQDLPSYCFAAEGETVCLKEGQRWRRDEGSQVEAYPGVGVGEGGVGRRGRRARKGKDLLSYFGGNIRPPADKSGNLLAKLL